MVLTSTAEGFNFGYLVAVLSTLIFFANNAWTLSAITPASAKTNKHQEWKWRNIANSLFHSFVTGCGACLCFWQTPEMREDLISTYTHSSHLLVAFSIGYFIYDFIDMAHNDLKSKSYELMVHHTMVILCFMVSMTQRLYMGYTLMALLVEVNSVFLHIRQLMLIQNWSKGGTLYRLNSSLNLGTFVVFRILTLGWMTRWLVQHRYDLDVTAFNLAGASLAVIMVMNIVLLQRVLNSDYRQCPKPAQPLPANTQTEETIKAR